MGKTVSFPKTQLSADKIVIVTGGNSGIGYETAKWVAMLGATVIIACRSEERADKAIKKMKSQFIKEKRKSSYLTENLSVEFMKLDLASLKSVMSFIEEFKASGRSLHALVNYLSHFLIVAHFLPIMMRSGRDCRIVFVSSNTHRRAKLNLNKIQGIEYSASDFPSTVYYGNSKLYQIMHMYSLNRRIKHSNVTVTSLHPGYSDTQFNRAFEDRRCASCLWCCFINGCGKSATSGARTCINAVVNPRLAGIRDAYFIERKQKIPKDVSRNEIYQEQLWDYTKDLLKDYLPDDMMDYLDKKRTV
ncbi:hypothetical protein KUTeg_006643 [Tegillarca granosa]|uniref:Uncharacterized protein n=1 Tax=Tegillarca granosa TaxID=220873 RepID=A0ABQ9FAW1_TEGGR|nr:hypothetical protein KUTeg_006643 [Tegillarca granosa]